MEVISAAMEQEIALPNTLEDKIAAIDSLGLSICRKRVEKLLHKTNGDFAAVRDFVIASNNLKEATKKSKLEKKLAKREHKGRIEKQGRKNRQDAARGISKEEKKIMKEERKSMKDARKDARKKRVESSSKGPLLESWPAEGSRLFLDGNNMLYVLAPIRALAIKRSNVAGAEMALQQMAKAFSEKMNLERCSLVFDDTRTKINEPHFEVFSARPTFATSDDALVECAKKTKGLFVTSDRGLIERLQAEGALVCSPKAWFNFAARMLNDQPVADLDNWANQWVDQLSNDVENKLRV